MKIFSISFLTIAAVILIGPVVAQNKSANNEPTDAKEAAAKKAAADILLEKAYQGLVAKLPPEQQLWEITLQENLGRFYLPIHKQQKIKGQSNAWDYVEDDPKLPRVLLIGDSVSRAYTLGVRKALAGKANVHRAPANCGPTSRGMQKIDVWLGDDKWDIIHFNFGIHDRNTSIADYTQRLKTLVERMNSAGEKLIWASTTPIPDVAKTKQTAASIVDRNQAAAAIMKENEIVTNDLFTFITPFLKATQIPEDVHFKPDGYKLLAKQVAEFIEGELK